MIKNKSAFAYLIVYLTMLMLGCITMIWPEVGFDRPTLYSAILFFIITFFSFCAYFYARYEENNYELLLSSLISVATASYLFAFNYTKASYILGTGFLMFSLLNAIIRIYSIDKLKKENNSLWLFRVMILILVLFLSTLTIQNFYRFESAVQTIMVGYYFISFGVISTLEIIVLLKLKPEVFDDILNGKFEKLGKSRKKLSRLGKTNENVEKLDEIVKSIETTKRKKK